MMNTNTEPENKTIWHVDDMPPDGAIVLVWFEYENPAGKFQGYGLGHYLKDIDDWILSLGPPTLRKEYSLKIFAWHYLPAAPKL